MEYDTDSDSSIWGDDMLYDADELDALPRGGDTSDVEPEPEPELERHSNLTRGRSVKRLLGLDGFRGSGGFLIGNSLGVERAGTNRRRHYISLPARLRVGTADTSGGENQGEGYERERIRRRWIGTRVREWRAERRRRELKKRIGVRFYVDKR